MEEVRHPCDLDTYNFFKCVALRQNLRDEVAMDVDEEDEESGSTQRLKRVPDYGIEVDFEVLSGEEREVSGTHPHVLET